MVLGPRQHRHAWLGGAGMGCVCVACECSAWPPAVPDADSRCARLVCGGESAVAGGRIRQEVRRKWRLPLHFVSLPPARCCAHTPLTRPTPSPARGSFPPLSCAPLPALEQVIPSNFQIQGMHTIIRDRNTSKEDFVFYADRLNRLVRVQPFALQCRPLQGLRHVTLAGNAQPPPAHCKDRHPRPVTLHMMYIVCRPHVVPQPLSKGTTRPLLNPPPSACHVVRSCLSRHVGHAAGLPAPRSLRPWPPVLQHQHQSRTAFPSCRATCMNMRPAFPARRRS